jgi:2'-5' RNA ligase
LRLFVGLFPPAEARADLRGALPPTAKLTRVDRWHITLVFLGEVAGNRLPEVSTALERVSAPRRIHLRLAGGGRFANARSTALWAGIQGDTADLTALRQDLRRSLTEAGLPSDSRPYRPHLTVAHSASEEVCTSLTDYTGPAWSVEEYVLVRSRYEEGGGYERVGGWPC